MKKLILFGMFLFCVGLTGSGFAQTAAQYIDAGNQSYGTKDYAKAVQYYQAATQMDPNSAAAFQGLGNSQYSLGQNSEALAAYEKALALNPNNPQLSTFVQSLRAKVGAAPATSAVVVPTPAQNMASPSASGGSANKFELDVNAGVAFGSGATGFGGGLGGFVPLDKSLALGVLGSFYTFGSSASGYGATASASLNFLEGLAAVKYRIDASGFHPYLFGGAGVAMVMTSASASGFGTTISASASEIDPMIAIGGGAEFPAGPNMNFFIQAKYSMIFIPGVTVNTGYGTYSGGGGTSTYIPIEGGLNFNL